MTLEHLLNRITQSVVCSQCAEEFASGQTDSKSLQDYSVLDVGFTDRGFQVWCRRHDVNVVHIDFAENRLEADFRSLIPKGRN